MDHRRVAVIGAGPAGLMAAGQAAARGAEVVVFERKTRPARKLAITGKGRCNLTNKAPLDDFIDRFGPNGRFLRTSFSHFFSEDLIRFLNNLGVETGVERGGRVFPLSDNAGEVVEALVGWTRKKGVDLRTGIRVRELIVNENTMLGLRFSPRGSTENTEDYSADKVILATGGASYPATGSTGDGYRLAESVGHSIIPVRPALVPLETSGNTAQRLQGLSLKNVRLRVLADGKRAGDIFGEMLFTHYGVSGPIVLTISRTVVDLLRHGRKVSLSIDLKPALDEKKLDNRIVRDLTDNGSKKLTSILKLLIPRKLIPVCLESAVLPPEKPGNQVGAGERRRLREWLKDMRLDVSGHRSFDEAIVTAGGVNLKEVNPRTLESRLMKNLYIAGELLDIDADTGGFNLQAAFSTGFLAGLSVSQ